MYLIGYDIGSSSIKAALVAISNGKTVATTKYPQTEMAIQAPQPGWAEQDPEAWWEHLCRATKKLLAATNIDADLIKAIGISYQMHGLVLVDKAHKVIRPSIIWCDSRAVEIGNKAFKEIGAEQLLPQTLNAPGNFTASKLNWVRQHEPTLFEQVYKMMLPGDYIAMKLSGQINTTASGLSEGILWDFQNNQSSKTILDHYQIEEAFIPEVVPTLSTQGILTEEAAQATGLKAGTPIGYRAGDQPNNALSLNTLKPGEVAATGGTSGVVYGVVDKLAYDPLSRVNSFAHVNHQVDKPSIGILLCINGAGIQYSWMHHQVGGKAITYPEMEQMALQAPIGSDHLSILPFGNGAERMLNNIDIGSHLVNLQFNRHDRSHLFRATLEGIAFAFVYGMKILEEMGLNVGMMRVGNDNLFQSHIFSSTIATLMNSQINVVETTGAVGAAKAAGVGVGIFSNLEEALDDIQVLSAFEPVKDTSAYLEAYSRWEKALKKQLG